MDKPNPPQDGYTFTSNTIVLITSIVLTVFVLYLVFSYN